MYCFVLSFINVCLIFFFTWCKNTKKNQNNTQQQQQQKIPYVFAMNKACRKFQSKQQHEHRWERKKNVPRKFAILSVHFNKHLYLYLHPFVYCLIFTNGSSKNGKKILRKGSRENKHWMLPAMLWISFTVILLNILYSPFNISPCLVFLFIWSYIQNFGLCCVSSVVFFFFIHSVFHPTENKMSPSYLHNTLSIDVLTANEQEQMWEKFRLND